MEPKFPRQETDTVLHTMTKQENKRNPEEHPSLLLFSRLSNKVIRGQVLKLLSLSELSRKGKKIYEVVVDAEGNVIPDETTEEKIKLLAVEYKVVPDEILEECYDKTLERIKTITSFDYTNAMSRGGNFHDLEQISLKWIYPHTGKILDAKQLAIVEAHEKGHSIRPYGEKYFVEHFMPGFDLEKCTFSDSMWQYLTGSLTDSVQIESETQEERLIRIVENYKKYLFSGPEIAERMSQLKNYCGISDDTEYTLDDLMYARRHYIQDTNIDNGMFEFFSAITSDTEREFIRLMNSSGI